MSDINNPAFATPTYTTSGLQKSYRVQIADAIPAANATDVLTITGSASKKIIISRIQITADANSAAVVDFYVYRRAAANTGGAATNPPILKNDSQNPAPVAVVQKYTANPTINDSGILAAGDHYNISATTGVAFFTPPWIEDFGRNAQGLTLNGPNEVMAVNLGGAALPAGFNIYIMVEWTEQ